MAHRFHATTIRLAARTGGASPLDALFQAGSWHPPLTQTPPHQPGPRRSGRPERSDDRATLEQPLPLAAVAGTTPRPTRGMRRYRRTAQRQPRPSNLAPADTGLLPPFNQVVRG